VPTCAGKSGKVGEDAQAPPGGKKEEKANDGGLDIEKNQENGIS